MALPSPNPIDTQIFNRGAPISHIETIEMICPACESIQLHEKYRVIVTPFVGFGAPFFVAPFKKRASTKGKIGKRAVFAQCHGCTSLWAVDANAETFSIEQWLNPQGFISESKQFEMLNKEYEEDEYHLREQTTHDDEQPRTSKVRKLPPEQ